MKSWILERLESKKMPYILSFFLPLFIMVGVCINHGIYPFGENSFLHIDMYHQYAPFFMEFLHKLKEHGNLMYSWNLGIGSDFLTTYVYYLASPVNWFVFFCPEKYLIEFMTILVLLKIAASGLFFAIYLGKHFKCDSYLITLVSMFYALSAFVSAYSWNIMWLDCIMLAPLIILALERLVFERKCYMYCILLGLCILSNYYISIMICIFLVLYFCLMQFEACQTVSFKADRKIDPAKYRKEMRRFRVHSFCNFTIYSLFAGAFAAILLIPEMIALGYSGSGDFDFPDTCTWYFSILQELARHCVDIAVYTGRDHWPNIYCGAAVLLLMVLYILNKNISIRKKIARLVILVFFLVSFANNWLDFIWHGMHFPDSLPGRQSFLYIFVLLVIAYETLLNLKGNQIWHIAVAVVVDLAFILFCWYGTDEILINRNAILMTGTFILAYAVLLFIRKAQEQSGKLFFYCMAFFITILEVGMNMEETGVVTTNRSQYTRNWDAYTELTNQEAQENDGFYRTEKWERLTKNESCLTGYRSASLFSSLMNYSVGTFYRELGMEGGKNFYCYNGATPLTSAMLSVKYLMTSSDAEESPMRKLVGESDGMYLYENKYVLPLGFMVKEDLEDNWDYAAGTCVQAQNSLARELGAEQDLLTPIPVIDEDGETSITVEQSGYVYATYLNNMANTITADIGGKIKTFSKCSHMYMLDLGWCEAGTVIKLSSVETTSLMAQAYQINMDSLNKAYQELNTETMTLDDFKDTKIDGHITVQNPGKLVLSIPCEEGWTLYVDGVETEKEPFMDSLISVSLDAGEHDIKLKYETPGLKAGAIISASSIALFGVIVLIRRKSEKEKKKQIKM